MDFIWLRGQPVGGDSEGLWHGMVLKGWAACHRELTPSPKESKTIQGLNEQARVIQWVGDGCKGLITSSSLPAVLLLIPVSGQQNSQINTGIGWGS